MLHLTQKRIFKLLSRSYLSFRNVPDTRAHRSAKQPKLAALMRLFVSALSSGQRVLRHIEWFVSDLDKGMRRFIGLGKAKVSDTALYEILTRTLPVGFRQMVQAMVRSNIDSKAIGNDLFAGGIASYDGKNVAHGYGDRPNAMCMKTFFSTSQRPGWRLHTLRSSLTSCTSRPILNQDFLPNKRAETTAFESVFKQDCKHFPRLFRYVTADAGITSRHNAQVIIDAKKDYVFAIKANHKAIFEHVKGLLVDQPVAYHGEEIESGRGLVRRDFRQAPYDQTVFYPGAKQVWLVSQTAINRDGKLETEERYFITSIDDNQLTAKRKVKLVRLHWGIENGPNWTCDVIFKEDTHCPCRRGFGPTVMSWLNVITYNLVAVFRAHLPKQQKQLLPYKRVVQTIYHVWIRCQPIVFSIGIPCKV